MTEVVVAPLAMTVTSSSAVVQMSNKGKMLLEQRDSLALRLESPAFITCGMKGIDVACISSFGL